MWNDHWSIMKPAYFIIWFSLNINSRFSIKWCSRAQSLYSTNMWSTRAVWKQYNKIAVLHFFLVISTLIYILFSLKIGVSVHCTTQLLCLSSLGYIKSYFQEIYISWYFLQREPENCGIGRPSSLSNHLLSDMGLFT